MLKNRVLGAFANFRLIFANFPGEAETNIFPIFFLFRAGVVIFSGQIQKNPRVRKIFVRDSWAGNSCANFMGAWKNAFFLQEKPMSIKVLVLGGPVFGVWGGGECRFYFYGRDDFSESQKSKTNYFHNIFGTDGKLSGSNATPGASRYSCRATLV